MCFTCCAAAVGVCSVLEGKLADAHIRLCEQPHAVAETSPLLCCFCCAAACVHVCSVLEGKLAEARSKKDTLKARAASAKTSKQIQEMVGNLNTNNSVVAFDKMEEKVRRSVP
jgi:NAD/NADP transhydrogenase beta subunit